MIACLLACMHAHMLYACMCLCGYVGMCSCVYVCMYACMHVCMYECMHAMYVCMYACVFMYVGMYLCNAKSCRVMLLYGMVWYGNGMVMYACMHACYVCMYVWTYGRIDGWMHACRHAHIFVLCVCVYVCIISYRIVWCCIVL